MISAGIGWVQPLAGLGALSDLEGQGFSTAQLEKRVYSAFIPPMLYQDKLYAVPVVANPRLLAYSKSAFREAELDPDRPPQSFAELRTDAKKLTTRSSNGQIKQAGFDFWAAPSSYRRHFVNFLGAAGGTLFNGSTPQFDSPEGARALSTMRDMILVDKSSQYGYQNTAQTSLVTAGQAGMGFASPYVDCSNGPNGIGRKKCSDLVYFNQAISAIDVGVPVDKSAASSDFVRNNPAGRFAVAHLNEAIMEYGGTNFLDFRDACGPAVDEALLRKKSPADALSSLDEIARNSK